MAGKYDERIDAGIALLDADMRNWRDKIDLETLNLETGHDCILGQVYGDLAKEMGIYSGFDAGKYHLYGYENSSTYGFDVSYNLGDTYKGLQKAWVRKLQGFVSRA